MQVRTSRMCIIALISLFSLFATQAEAQSHVFNQPSGSPMLRPKSRKAQMAKTSSGYTYSVLYNFCSAANCTDGKTPNAGLIEDAAGNLYGTTIGGGISSSSCQYDSQFIGCGTVFKIDIAGHETVLHAFCSVAGCVDGANPTASLIQDAEGNLYGTTYSGGANGGGTVFKVDNNGNETVLYSFCSASGCSDGKNPYAGLIRDADGNLYGTTVFGGNSNSSCSASTCGTVFQLDNTNHETVLYPFCSASGCTDGANPYASLLRDAAGNLYGTTYEGGNDIFECSGCGTVFKLDGAGHETVLHAFCTPSVGCADGYGPMDGLIEDAASNLYGTTSGGGVNDGTVFKLDSSGAETVLYNFCSLWNCADGGQPYAGLIQDAAGNLYGTTTDWGAHDGGIVFMLDDAGNETVLYNFCSDEPGSFCLDGAAPVAGVIQDGEGNLYGSTPFGGGNDGGAVFALFTGVGGRPVTVTATSTPNPSAQNRVVTLSAVVLGRGPTPGGTVTFEQGTIDLGTVTLSGGNASLTTTFTTTGSFSIVAEYSGDANYQATNSSPFTQVVTPYIPSVALTSNVNPSFVDQSVTFSAVVSGNEGPPTGAVEFKEGTTVLGTVVLGAGNASFTTAFTKNGTISIVASYLGDEHYKAENSKPLREVVEQYTTNTALASTPNPSTYSQAVTLTATVSSAGPVPAGIVTFKNGSTPLGIATLSGSVAKLTKATLTAGTSTITASYGGDAPDAKSTSLSLTQVVNQATSKTTLGSSPNPSTAGQNVTFKATVTSPTTKPTGTVTFMDGTTVLGTGTIAGGKASYSTAALSAGSHNITAVYSGTANITGSTTSVLVQTVN